MTQPSAWHGSRQPAESVRAPRIGSLSKRHRCDEPRHCGDTGARPTTVGWREPSSSPPARYYGFTNPATPAQRGACDGSGPRPHTLTSTAARRLRRRKCVVSVPRRRAPPEDSPSRRDTAARTPPGRWLPDAFHTQPREARHSVPRPRATRPKAHPLCERRAVDIESQGLASPRWAQVDRSNAGFESCRSSHEGGAPGMTTPWSAQHRHGVR